MGDLSNGFDPGHDEGSPKAAHICHSLAIVHDPESGGKAGSQRDSGEIHLKGRRSGSDAKKYFEKRMSNVRTRQNIKQIAEIRRLGNVVRDPANISMTLAPQNQSPFFSELSSEMGFQVAA
jgi:hypothetical protein